MPEEQPLTRTEMIALLTDLKLEVFERIDAAELRSREHTEKIETRLLTAFHNWATPVNHRLRKLENADSGVLERLASVEERLTNLELRP